MHAGSPQTRDSLILRLPSASDAAAWQEFVAIYEPLIYRFAVSQGLQDADARELIQSVLLAVAGSVARWEPDPQRGSFRAWLFRIARNQLVSLLRKRRPDRGSGRTSQLMRLQQVAECDSLGGKPDQADGQMEIDYQRALLVSAAQFLKDTMHERTWQAFWMTCVEGRPIEAAVSELQMTRGAVYIARSRVLLRLRNLIQAWEERDD